MHDERLGYLLLAPLIFVVFARTLFPVFETLRLSFHRVDIRGGGISEIFVGLTNWNRLFADPKLVNYLITTALFTSVVVGLGFVLSLLFALVLNQSFRGQRILKAAVIIPWAVPAITAGLMWMWMFGSEYGIINGILFKLGIIDSFQFWLGEPTTARFAVIVAQLWKTIPFMTLLLYAALQMVPQPQYESAHIDGASMWNRFIHITIPNIRTTAIFAVMMQTIESVKVFDIIYMMTAGGPYESTKILYLYVYEQGFGSFNFGYAAVLAFLVLFLIAFLTFTLLRFFKPSIE